jgi:DnaJ-class molecular chaperone
MEFKDYYRTLGVPKTASAKDIKAAYRRLARKYHPDVNPGNREAEARFKEVNEANEVLSDPDKRRRYDQLGADWRSYDGVGARSRPAGRGRENVGGPAGEPDLGGFSDFFRTFFGGGGPWRAGRFEEVFRRARREPAREAEADVELTLEEVLHGATRTVELGRDGNGGEMEVKIPAGVSDGTRVRVGSDRASGGPPIHLYLRVHVRPHPPFERRGDDLHVTFTVPLTTAILGGEAQVPTLEGPVGIKVPAGSSVGRVFRLRDHGLPRLEAGGGRGDLLAALQVELPRSLTAREKELFEELRRHGR